MHFKLSIDLNRCSLFEIPKHKLSCTSWHSGALNVWHDYGQIKLTGSCGTRTRHAPTWGQTLMIQELFGHLAKQNAEYKQQ